jgi:ketosteroid isomerase-like protein
VDQAWQLEQDSWAAVVAGDAATFFAKIMTDDAFVVVPDAVLGRDDLVARFQGPPPWQRYTLDDEKLVLLDGETVLVSYHVTAERDGTPGYRGRVTSMYTWLDGGWALAFRQHTPDSPGPPADGGTPGAAQTREGNPATAG